MSEALPQNDEQEAKTNWGPEMWEMSEAQSESEIAPKKLQETAPHEDAPFKNFPEGTLMTPEALHQWIVDELGDTELALRVGRLPEFSKQIIDGDSPLSPSWFALLRNINKENESLAMELVQMAHDHGRFLSSNVSKIIDDTLTAREQEAFVLSHHFQITESATIKTPSTLEKSEHELAMIDYSNIELQKIRAKFGLDAYTVTHNQVEVYGGSQLGSATNGNAILGHADMLRQRTLLVKDENQTEDERMALIMHELVHAHAYGAVEVWKDVRGARHVAVARRGLCVRNRKQNSTSSDTSYLNTLNEAVTEELSNRILYDIPVDHPEFGEMITRRKKIIQDISKDQPRYFDRYRRPHWIPAFREEVENNQKSLRAKTAYTDEKCLMYFMFKKIYEHDPSRFKGGGQEEADEEMFSILTKAAFTGNILPFGRLFSETFGNGKFREFGHLQTVEEQKEFIEKL